MKRISLAATAALFVFVLALTGCAGHKADAESLKGFWQIESPSAVGFDAALNLEDEDMAELLLADTYLDGTWTTNGSEATIEFEESGSARAYVSGDKLILGADNGSKLVFVKGNMDEYLGTEVSTEVEGVEGMEGLGSDVETVEEDIKDIDPVTIADDNTCTITVTGKGTDFTADPGYRVTIKNNTDKTIYVVADEDFKVNGGNYEAGIGEVVDPKDEIETFLYFSHDELGGGVDKLKGVEGKLFVGDDDTSEQIATYDFKMD